MSILTAESGDRLAQASAVKRRGKARFWDREAPLAYLFMIPGLVILFSSWPTPSSWGSIFR